MSVFQKLFEGSGVLKRNTNVLVFTIIIIIIGIVIITIYCIIYNHSVLSLITVFRIRFIARLLPKNNIISFVVYVFFSFYMLNFIFCIALFNSKVMSYGRLFVFYICVRDNVKNKNQRKKYLLEMST